MIQRILAAIVVAAWATAIAVAAPWNAGPGVIFTPASSGTSQVFTTTTTALSNSDRFFPLNISSSALSATDIAGTVFSTAGTLTKLRVSTTIAPTGTQTHVITINKNGTGSALTCTIDNSSSPAGTCTDLINSVAVVAGDYASVLNHTTNSPSTSAIHTVSAVFTPTVTNETVLGGRSVAAGFSTTVQNAINIGGMTTAASTLANRQTGFVSEAGVLDKLYIVSTAPGAPASGKKYDYILGKNGVTTSSPACSIIEDATTCNDPSTTLTIADTDNVQLSATPTGAVAAAVPGFSGRFVPTTSGQFMFVQNNGGVGDGGGTATMYYGLSGPNSTTEASAQSIVDSLTVTKMYVKLSGTAGGSGKVFTLRDNAVDTALTCSIAAGATTCTATGTIAVSAGHLLSVADASSAASSRNVSITVSAHR